MAAPLSLVFDILAVDRASAVFTRVGAAAETTGASVGRFAAGAGLAAAAVGVFSIKAAAEFQAKMLLIQTQAGATGDEVKAMGPKILTLAGQVAQAPEALAVSLYHVESVGLRGAAALNVVASAAKLATVSHSDLEQTTNALTAAVASGIPGVQDMNQAIGALNATVGSGDMKMSDLNEALGSGLLTVVKGYGLSMADVSAALATFGDNNIRGANAATMLRMSVQAMAVPVKNGDAILKALGVTTGQADQALGKYGISAKALATDMQTGGLNKALMDLKDHLDKAGVKGNEVGDILTQAFGKKAGPGVAVLLSQFDRLQTKYADVNKATGDFGSEWEATTKTASFAFHALEDNIKAIAIRIGSVLLPPVAAFAGGLNSAIAGIGPLWNRSGLQRIADDLGTYWSRNREAVTRFVGDLGSSLTAGFAAMVVDVAPLAARIRDALAATGGELISGITTAVRTGDLAPLGKAIGDALGTAVRGSAVAIVGIGSALGSLMSKIKWDELGLKVGKQMVPFALGIVVGFLNNIQAVFPFIRDHFWETLLAALSIIPIGRVAGVLGKAFEAIPILRWFAPLLGKISSAGGAVEGAFAWVFRRVGSVIKDVLDYAFPGASRAAADFVTGIAGTVRGFVGSVIAAARDLVTRFADTIRNGIVVTIGDVIAWVARLGGSFVGGIAGVARAVAGRAFGLMVEFHAALSGGFGEVIGFVGSIPGRILGALGDLGGLLVGAGRRLVGGLASGIKSSIGGALGDAMGSVSSFIKDHLPGSPVKRGPLTSWNNGAAGVRLMDMLASGIVKGGPRVQLAMGQVAGGMGVPAPRLAMTAGSDGPVRLHPNDMDTLIDGIGTRLLVGASAVSVGTATAVETQRPRVSWAP